MGNLSKVTAMAWVTLAISLGVFIGAVCIPLIEIWCLNTLFPTLAIPYTFTTWGAMFVLSVIIQLLFRNNTKQN